MRICPPTRCPARSFAPGRRMYVSESHSLDRRDFVKVVIGVTGTIMGAVIGLPAISYLISPARQGGASEAWIPLGPLENYPVGTPTQFNFTRTKINGWEKTVNSYGVYVVRFTENEADLRVFSNMCTHLSCRVTWEEDPQQYICPCHDAHFAMDGAVISGPPPRPLVEYEHKIEEGSLFILFKEGVA